MSFKCYGVILGKNIVNKQILITNQQKRNRQTNQSINQQIN